MDLTNRAPEHRRSLLIPIRAKSALFTIIPFIHGTNHLVTEVRRVTESNSGKDSAGELFDPVSH
jgi:hypothetical protein